MSLLTQVYVNESKEDAMFYKWLIGKKFNDIRTGSHTPFSLLSNIQKKEIRDKYNKEKQEADKAAEEAKEKQKAADKAASQNPSSISYKWTEAKLSKLGKEFGKDAKKELGDGFEGAAPDLALSFLQMYPGVRYFLSKSGVDRNFHIEYITELF